jgi:hypothetical protein
MEVGAEALLPTVEVVVREAIVSIKAIAPVKKCLINATIC